MIDNRGIMEFSTPIMPWFVNHGIMDFSTVIMPQFTNKLFTNKPWHYFFQSSHNAMVRMNIMEKLHDS